MILFCFQNFENVLLKKQEDTQLRIDSLIWIEFSCSLQILSKFYTFCDWST